jgi:hypothetical protein
MSTRMYSTGFKTRCPSSVQKYGQNPQSRRSSLSHTEHGTVVPAVSPQNRVHFCHCPKLKGQVWIRLANCPDVNRKSQQSITIQEPAHTGTVHGKKDVDEAFSKHVIPQKLLVNRFPYWHDPASLKIQLNEDDHIKIWFDWKTLKNEVPINVSIHDDIQYI